ncbi:MAG: FHA domain-containing protein [Armatimonadetes bacterium]|nr:FHA domain-containing protein [Armatimonadota bacterium]
MAESQEESHMNPGIDLDLPRLGQPLGKLATRPAAEIATSRFSVGCECLDRGMWQFQRTLPHLARLGAKWARVQTGWGRCERTPGQYDFTWLDEIVDALRAVGIQPWFNVGYGNNRIGRAPTENISLDFGDEEISRENHATITFDGRHRRFYILPGQGRNLVYVNEQPVMSPQELTGGEDILLGQTKLRFVPFCGKSFDWYQK